MRYFVVVGGVLLALLFISDAVLPKQSLPSYMSVVSSDLPPMRIRSDRKWPERIVFDTSAPAVRPVVMAEAQPAPPTDAAAMAAKPDVRDAFARFPRPASSRFDDTAEAKVEAKAGGKVDAKTDTKTDQGVAKVAEARPQPKRKAARTRPSRPMILVAQQPHFELFESTW